MFVDLTVYELDPNYMDGYDAAIRIAESEQAQSRFLKDHETTYN